MAKKIYKKKDINPLEDFKWCFQLIEVEGEMIRKCEVGEECECD